MLSGHRARPTITALVTTLNEEKNIAACLESLLWCDEILVVDSHSTDRTEEIARSLPKVRFVQRTYFGSASQKNWAMDRIDNEWILILDADERCTEELRDEILALLEKGPESDAYTLGRRVYFLGKVLRFSGWQRDRVVRLVRRGTGRYPNRRVHADMVTTSAAPILNHRLEHYMVTDISEYARRTTKYAWWGAAQLYKENRTSGPVQIVGRSLWRFARTYILQGGVLDGMRGLLFCLIQTYGTFLKWAIAWSWSAGIAQSEVADQLPNFDDDTATWRGLENFSKPAQPVLPGRPSVDPQADPLTDGVEATPTAAGAAIRAIRR
jgi:hypothetical protein